MILKDGAIFIADAHYNSEQTILLKLLNDINSSSSKPPQIFLMGDIFDFLCDEIEYFKYINQKVILLLNSLSSDIPIIYLEGNHDFNLNNIFPNVKVISRKQQPIDIINDKTTISLSHGDIFTPVSYNIYTSIFRNHYFLKFLNLLDINFFISKFSEKKLKLKEICNKQENFDIFIKKRVKNYNCDLAIEGHYHQGYLSSNYINIPSLCCDSRFMLYKNKKFKFIDFTLRRYFIS